MRYMCAWPPVTPRAPRIAETGQGTCQSVVHLVGKGIWQRRVISPAHAISSWAHRDDHVANEGYRFYVGHGLFQKRKATTMSLCKMPLESCSHLHLILVWPASSTVCDKLVYLTFNKLTLQTSNWIQDNESANHWFMRTAAWNLAWHALSPLPVLMALIATRLRV